MASQTRELSFQMPPQQAYDLIQQAGSQLPGFRVIAERRDQGYMKFERFLGWSNPMAVEVRLQIVGEQAVRAQLTAKLLALADPLGFMKGVLDMFEQHLYACAQATAHDQPWPPAPSHDKSGLQKNLILLGVIGGFTVLVVGGMFLLLVLVR